MVCSRLLWCIAVGAVCAPGAHAQSGATGYPEKPIRMVVPFATGGALDVVGRIVGQKMTETWGKPVIIDNRLGAGGNIGAECVTRSAPDGYTLLGSSVTTQAINMSLQSKPGYDFDTRLRSHGLVRHALSCGHTDGHWRDCE